MRLKCPVFDKKSQEIQRKQESMAHLRKKKKKPREAVPEKDLKVEPLDDGFKITALKILKELKENRES